MPTLLVIGGGPAGMSAAISASQAGLTVELWDKNEKLGKKLYITGKGRCNLTNDCTVPEFLQNVVDNPKFVFSSLMRVSPHDTIAFFNALGLKTKVERGRRVFPESDHASDVIKYFAKALNDNKVTVKLQKEVARLDFSDDHVTAVTKDGYQKTFDAVIVATGGISYPATGSTGDGYTFAKASGHEIITPVSGLVGLKVKNAETAEMAGLALKNSSLKVVKDGKQLYCGTGELLFTHIGLSGALALTASMYVNRIKDFSGCFAIVDLKPYVDEKEEDARILKVFNAAKNKDVVNVMGELLPSSIIPFVLRKAKIPPHKKVNSVTAKEREELVKVIKGATFPICGVEDVNGAVVTCGGVKTSEVDPKTMRSKKQKLLFFAGEVLDVAALTGGYNIQIAISTGFAAGNGAAECLKKHLDTNS